MQACLDIYYASPCLQYIFEPMKGVPAGWSTAISNEAECWCQESYTAVVGWKKDDKRYSSTFRESTVAGLRNLQKRGCVQSMEPVLSLWRSC